MMVDRSAEKTMLWVVLAVAALLFFFRLGDRSLRNPDEGRYAEIGREMAISGDWVEPTLYGIEYLKKPPLFYWLLALSFRAFGANEWTARLVPALAGWLGVWVIYLFSRRTFGTRTAQTAAWVVSTNFWYLQVARYLVIDAVFSFFVVSGLLAFYLALQGTRARFVYQLIFYLCSALAFLSKGPVALALVASTLLIYAVLARAWRSVASELLRGAIFGVPLFAAVALPWFAAVAKREPWFLGHFFWHEHIHRVVSSNFEHQEPWYFYILVTAAALFPWILVWKPAPVDWKALRAERGPSSPRNFLLSMVLGTLLFYSISRSKMATYILPAMAPACMLIADAWTARGSQKLFRWLTGTMVLISLIFPFLMETQNRRYTTKPFAEVLKPLVREGDEVLVYDQPSPFYDFEFYLERPVRLVGLEGEFENAHPDEQTRARSISREEFGRLLSDRQAFYCLIRRSDFSALDPEIRGSLSVLAEDSRKVLFASGSLSRGSA